MSAPNVDQYLPLKLSDYYHGELRQEFLQFVLLEDGDFLIRRASDGSNVISVLVKGKIYKNYKPDYDGETYR